MEIRVENLKCSGCASGIRKALSGLPGVQHVVVDVEAGTVHVEGNPEKESLIQKLSQLGYPPVGHNNLKRKAQSYVSCMLGSLSEK
ncbi:MAG: heavy-metal-associated domain-containing protein [Flavobacteriales bacterium]|nr:heavy-metal-associated domain-containing protein [Flavobacteriales bacterium]MCX7650109.1 heavy-metal-associated domain-containing protein [Flavobacteriales bacterium]MDW8431461.1 heavy metal-associated domain-containing protein [Flavobacteriales bacterium]